MHHSEELPELQTQDFLPPLGQWVKFGGLLIITILGAAVAIAAVAQYRVTVKAPAVIRPQGELRLVQAATAGTIRQVQVVENQTVERGQVIATTDDSQLQTKKSQLQHALQQGQLQIVQIEAQIQAMTQQINAERDRQNRAVAFSEAEWSQRQREYQDQQVVSSTAVAEATAALKSAQSALSAAQVRLERYRIVAEAGALGRDRLEETELAAQQQQQEVVAASARLQRAKTSLHPSRATVTMATARIAQERASGMATLAALHKEQEALIQQQIQMQNQFALDQQDLKQVVIDLQKTTITATTSGTIAKLSLRNAGQTVQSGDEIAQIVPSQMPLMIKALVAAQDIGKIAVGQSAQLRISACPYPDYGTLSGTVTTIAADATKPNGAQETAASPYYEVMLKPGQLNLHQGDRHCQIQVGMEGRIDIISREDTVLRSMLRQVRLISDW